MKKTSIIEVIRHVLAIMLILNFILPPITFVVNDDRLSALVELLEEKGGIFSPISSTSLPD